MRRWTDEELRHAVAAHRNISQVLRALGLRPVGANYDTVRRRIAALHIDTSHWGRISRIEVDEATLRRAVAGSRSIAECLRAIGWPDVGSRRKRLWESLNYFGIDTAHFLGERANLGRRFPQFVKPLSHYLVVDGPNKSSTWLRLRLIQEGVFEPACASCHRQTWGGRPIPLELDHINGNRHDNQLHNLRLLCPNCHALTPTYRGRNAGRYAPGAAYTRFEPP